MTIGGHTDTHPILARCTPSVQEREIRRGLDRLEAELGSRPGLFAYPVGTADSFDEHSRRAVAQAGLQVAFSFYEGANPWATWDPLDVRRIWPRRPPELVGIRASLPPLYVRSPVAPASRPGRGAPEPGPAPRAARGPGRPGAGRRQCRRPGRRRGRHAARSGARRRAPARARSARAMTS
jgi:peptidoglycan/xylan/chitin deacetylase (PgdA/CDA1 family)